MIAFVKSGIGISAHLVSKMDCTVLAKNVVGLSAVFAKMNPFISVKFVIEQSAGLVSTKMEKTGQWKTWKIYFVRHVGKIINKTS